MYSSGYNKLFWGILFIILKINIGAIDILPDFIGYLIIFSGLYQLSSQHPYYAKGRLPSMLLAILSLRNTIDFTNNNLLTGNVQMGNPWLGILGSVSMVINIYLIYIICNGICLVAEEKGLIEHKRSAAGTLKFYLAISTLYTLYFPFIMNLSRNMLVLLLLIIVVNFIAMISLAVLFRRSRAQLAD